MANTESRLGNTELAVCKNEKTGKRFFVAGKTVGKVVQRKNPATGEIETVLKTSFVSNNGISEGTVMEYFVYKPTTGVLYIDTGIIIDTDT